MEHGAKRLRSLLKLPPLADAGAQSVSTERHDGWRCETLAMTMPSGSAARGIMTSPAELSSPAPAILYIHAHGGDYTLGAAELTQGRPQLLGPLGPVFAGEGYVTLAIDLRCFGIRAHETEGATAKRLAWYGRTLLGDMIGDLAAALGWLAARPEVDGDRIAAFGMSMGATLAYFLAAVEPRIAAVAHLCCLADLATLVESGVHDRHGHYMTVPGLLAETSTGAIAGLIAPRPQFVGVGLGDALTPEPAFDRAIAEVRHAYAKSGVSEALRVVVEPTSGHSETAAHRQEVLAFLRNTIGGGRDPATRHTEG